MTPVKLKKSSRKFKIKELSHPGWKEWTPVIVMGIRHSYVAELRVFTSFTDSSVVLFLANRRSGNSDGVHILSYFRRVLNPCQVLDLSVHSPLLLLKWCSVIPPGVKLYVLVAGGDGTVAWILNTINESTIKLSVSRILHLAQDVRMGNENNMYCSIF